MWRVTSDCSSQMYRNLVTGYGISETTSTRMSKWLQASNPTSIQPRSASKCSKQLGRCGRRPVNGRPTLSEDSQLTRGRDNGTGVPRQYLHGADHNAGGSRNLVNRLRRRLGDDASTFIFTEPRTDYRTIAPHTNGIVRLRVAFKSTAHEYLSISCLM